MRDILNRPGASTPHPTFHLSGRCCRRAAAGGGDATYDFAAVQAWLVPVVDRYLMAFGDAGFVEDEESSSQDDD